MTGRLHTVAAAGLLAVLAAFSCTRSETVPLPGPQPARLTISGIEGLPSPVPFDRVKVEISGAGWETIATLEADYVDGQAVLALPAPIPVETLCKVARDTYNDYEGFWPAAQVSDRDAKVAGLRDIVAFNGDERVGRLYLTGWDGDPATKRGAWMAGFHYSDRDFTLSGVNLTAPGGKSSYIYEASFRSGWNPYFNIYDRPGDPKYSEITLTTTDIPDGVELRWRFEKW